MINITFSLLLLITGVLRSETVDNNAALYLAACTVENRVESGWTYNNVLEHYYAPYSEPNQNELNIVKMVLVDKSKCPNVYFVYSQEDVNKLFGENAKYMYKICENGKCNIFMSKQQFRDAFK